MNAALIYFGTLAFLLFFAGVSAGYRQERDGLIFLAIVWPLLLPVAIIVLAVSIPVKLGEFIRGKIK